jgi:hypothetical protein
LRLLLLCDFHARRTSFIIIRDAVDPRADWVAAHTGMRSCTAEVTQPAKVGPAVIGQSVEERANGEHLEGIDRARHAFRHFVEGLDDRLILVGNPYIEYYRQGRMALILHCEITLPSKFEVVTRFIRKNGLADKRVVFVVLKANSGKPHHIEYWDKQLMFVEDVQIVQGPEGMIRSLVGLYDIQENIHNQGYSRISGEALLFQSAINGSYQLFPLVADWKPCPMIGFPRSGGLESLVVQNIKSAFEIMQGISDDQSTVRHVESRFVNVEENAVVPSVFLDTSGVKVGLGERIEKFVKIVDVLHGPFNLTS